ncbi:unnamed protein product, partial [Prorocentrum cordatum]
MASPSKAPELALAPPCPAAQCSSADAPPQPTAALDALAGEVVRWSRAACPGCKHSGMFYCPFCCVPLGVPEGVEVPRVELPFGRCDVIFDDAAKKATSMHARVLAPDQVRLVDLYTSDGSTNRTLSRCAPNAEGTGASVVREVPAYDPRTTWVLFPDEGSSTFAEALAAEGLQGPGEVTIVAIDSPWRRAKTLRHPPAGPDVARLRSVRLARPPPSNFWRYHAEGEGCVSTVEALAQLAREA